MLDEMREKKMLMRKLDLKKNVGNPSNYLYFFSFVS